MTGARSVLETKMKLYVPSQSNASGVCCVGGDVSLNGCSLKDCCLGVEVVEKLWSGGVNCGARGVMESAPSAGSNVVSLNVFSVDFRYKKQ